MSYVVTSLKVFSEITQVQSKITYHVLLCFAAVDWTTITTAIYIFYARFHRSKCINRGSLVLSKPMSLQIQIVEEQHQNRHDYMCMHKICQIYTYTYTYTYQILLCLCEGYKPSMVLSNTIRTEATFMSYLLFCLELL
jgi:hypothetical protein